jgi:hypothetical protein
MNTTNQLNPAQRAAITRKRREAGRKAAATKNAEKQARHRLRAAMRYSGALIALADALKHCPPSRRIAILNAMPADLHSDFTAATAPRPSSSKSSNQSKGKSA